jgi:hypothetical protein
MPYISTPEVAAKRKALKEAFPKYKFSVTRHHYSRIDVIVLRADIDLIQSDKAHLNQNQRPYCQVSLTQSAIKKEWTGEAQEALLKMYDIIEGDNGTLVNDADYGDVPNFYTHLSIGDFDKDFIIVP